MLSFHTIPYSPFLLSKAKNSKPRGVKPQKYAGPDNLKCNNCKVLKLRRDTARQLRICDEQFWDLRVPTDGGDTELPDAYRRNIKIPISIYILWCPRK